MHPNKDAERTAYYRQQASACSAAALTTTIAEVKQAYLDLEQGWLSLAPKARESLDGSSETDPQRSNSGAAGRTSNENATCDPNCDDDARENEARA